MGGLFGGKTPQAQKQQPVGALNVQTSIYGSAYPLIYGKNRVPVNLIHYVNFRAIAHTTKQKTGGKGGGKAQSNTTYTYTVAMAAGMSVGGIQGVGTIWKNKEKHTAASLGLTVFTGGVGQTPWSYLSGAYPAQAVPYANLAYIASPSLDLGDSPSLPNLNVEVKGLVPYQAGTIDDALASDIVYDYLTNTRHGAGFGAYLANLDAGNNSFRKYCLARGLFLSPVEDNQRNAGAFLKDIAEITNTAIVWQNGKLNFIPYGDAVISGNGTTYTPNLTPLYDLTMDDFLTERGQPPVKHSAKNPSQQFNHVRIEYAARENDYNPLIVEVKDQADIDDNGLRTKSVTKYKAITQRPLARDVAQLQMQRDLFVVNSYSFRLGVRHSLLEPMDLLTITEPALGLDRQLVRITEVTEQDDSIDVTVEEMNVGVANAPLYNTVGPQGYNQDFNASPGNTQDPLIMNAPGLLTQTGYEMWMNVCGVNSSMWGGCQVWISDDDTDYRFVGTIAGPARYGALAANMAAGADYDTTSVLRAQLYNGQIIAGTQEDCDDFRTLLYVGGEWMSYRDAILVSGTTYDLDTFRRAAYGSTRTAHSTGEAIAVIDEATFRLPYDKGNIGKVVYFKFPAFNVFGAGAQDLSACPAYSHTIGASELTAPMSFADIAGNGVNILPDQYSVLEASGLPPIFNSSAQATLRGTAGLDTWSGYAGFSFQRTGAGDPYMWMSPSGNLNIPVSPGKRYILSAYVSHSQAGGQIRLLLNDGAQNYIALDTIATANQQVRMSWLFDLTGSTSSRLVVGFSNMAAVGSYFRVNGVMLEEAVGLLNKPSNYTRGQASSMAISAIAAAAAAQDTADGVIDVFYQGTAPSGAKLGDYWYDSSNGNRINRWNGSSWVLVQDSQIPAAISAAAGAQATADGKVKTFYALSTSAPTPSGVGDLWYQTDTAVLKRWNGSSWQLIGDNSVQTKSDGYLANADFKAAGEGWGGDITTAGGWFFETYNGLSGSMHATKQGTAQQYTALANQRLFPVGDGDGFTVSITAKQIGGNGQMYLGLVMIKDDGSYAWNADYEITSQIGGGTWKKGKVVIVLPPGTGGVQAYARIYTANHNAGYWYFDDMAVTKLSADALENLLGIGKNLIPNSEFGGKNGLQAPWAVSYNNGGGPPLTWTNKRQGIAAGAPWTIGGDDGQISCYDGASTGNFISDWINSEYITVEANTRYEFTAYLATHRCQIQLVVGWYDGNKTYITESGTSYSGPTSNGGQSLSGYTRHGAFFTSPSNAASARVWFRRTRTLPGNTDSYSWALKPFFGRATPNQTQFSDYQIGPVSNADGLSTGGEAGVVNTADLYDVYGSRRLGLRVTNSNQRLGSQRNTVRTQTSSYGSVRNTTALSATSAGVVNVNAHTVRYGSFNVTYNAVSNAVTGLSPGTTYVIYCYDGDYSGGTKTYYAGTNPDTIMQLGDDIIVIGQILVPTSGSSSGGGGGGGSNPGDWCVAADSFFPDGTLAEDLLPGDLLPCYNNTPEQPGIIELVTQANNKANTECVRMSTVSGATIVVSVGTPMTLRDGSCVLVPAMLGREALVYRLDGSFRWEEVVALEPVGVRRVAKISVSDQCYFAGETMDAFIATHNVQQMKP